MIDTETDKEIIDRPFMEDRSRHGCLTIVLSGVVVGLVSLLLTLWWIWPK